MKTFEDLKSQWEKQPEFITPNNGSKLIIEKVTFIKRKQRIANIVLTITSIILIGFFFYIKAYNNRLVTMALVLMIGSVWARICIEFLSIRKLKEINITNTASEFKQKIIIYYKSRIKIHYILTPIIIALYALGFIILLPFFKESLSSGFFTYIQVSSVVVLIVLGLFIRKQVQKELFVLKELQA